MTPDESALSRLIDRLEKNPETNYPLTEFRRLLEDHGDLLGARARKVLQAVVDGDLKRAREILDEEGGEAE